MSVIVVGGGWAGLAAAVELVRAGKQVTLIEAAPTLGGRARSVSHRLGRLDNGQHILLGAYRQVLSLLDTIGVDAQTVFRRSTLILNIRSRRYIDFQLKIPSLPKPWHLLFGISNTNGISRKEKVSILKFALQLRNQQDFSAPDQSVCRWLLQSGQTRKLVSLFWAPLCIAALNTPAHIASSKLFAHVLRLALMRRRADSDLLLPIRDLSQLFPIPAEDYLNRAGCRLVLRERVTGLRIKDNKISGLNSERQEYTADQVVLATSPLAALRLIQSHPQLNTTIKAISKINALPIYTAYLQYPQATTLHRDMQGLHGYTSQWLFDRGRLTGQDGMIASVISAAEQYLSKDKEEIIQSITSEIAQLYPNWPKALQTTLIREPQAAFTAQVDIMDTLPQAKTPIDGLWLAGDYTRNHLPATLESAVTAGIHCANEISKNNGHNIR